VYEYGEKDQACGLRALALLIAHKDQNNPKEEDEKSNPKAKWNCVRKSHAKKKTSKAAQTLQADARILAEEAGIEFATATSNKDLIALVKALHSIRGKASGIIVLDKGRGYDRTFETYWPIDTVVKAENVFYLLLSQNQDGSQHYDAITKPHAILGGQQHYCHHCHKTSKRKKHNCAVKPRCKICDHETDHWALWVTTDNKKDWRHCEDCSRDFYTTECFNQHLKKEGRNNLSDCDKRWKCHEKTCKKIYFKASSGLSIPGAINPEIMIVRRTGFAGSAKYISTRRPTSATT
jgi:hypothetical protein